MRPTICYCKEPCDDYFANPEAQCARGQVDRLKREREQQYRLGQDTELARWVAAFSVVFGRAPAPGLSPEQNLSQAAREVAAPLRDELLGLYRRDVDDCCGPTGCGRVTPCRTAARECELALQAADGWHDAPDTQKGGQS